MRLQFIQMPQVMVCGLIDYCDPLSGFQPTSVLMLKSTESNHYINRHIVRFSMSSMRHIIQQSVEMLMTCSDFPKPFI